MVMTVKEIYDTMVGNGTDPKTAAKEAQRLTGNSVVTGKKIKDPGPFHKTKRKWKYGVYE